MAELTIRKIVLFVLIGFVLFFGIFQISDLADTASQIKDISFSQCNVKNAPFINCQVQSCGENNQANCEDEMYQLYLAQQDYAKQCVDEHTGERKDCTYFQELVLDGVTDSQSPSTQITQDQITEKINQLKQTNGYISSLGDLATKLSLNVGLLNAITKIESNNDKDALRFECSIFNGKSSYHCLEFNHASIPDVPCDGTYGTSSQTGRLAYEQAKQIHADLAICASSQGMFQVLGSEAKKAGVASYQDYEIYSQTVEGQLYIFEKYLLYKPSVLNELKKSNPDFQSLAKYYNGANYADNNYDQKLQTYYS